MSSLTAGDPRLQISDEQTTQQLFGLDVRDIQPNSIITLNSSSKYKGYPLRDIQALPLGKRLYMQAVVQPYQRYSKVRFSGTDSGNRADSLPNSAH